MRQIKKWKGTAHPHGVVTRYKYSLTRNQIKEIRRFSSVGEIQKLSYLKTHIVFRSHHEKSSS